MLNTLYESEQEDQWHVERLDYNNYVNIVESKIRNVFSKGAFSELNAEKVVEVIYLIIYKKGSARFACTLGRGEDNVLRCPFSAPFGYLEEIKSKQSVSDFYRAAAAVNDYLDNANEKAVTITFPPLFYDNKIIGVWINALFQTGWKVEYFEINYAFHIPDIFENYESKIAHNARKNLRIAEQSGLQLVHCNTEFEKKEAYQIIKKNREMKGYPLRMSEEQVMKTIEIVKSDMYIVYFEGNGIASALVYEVTDDIVQVVYWGDIPGFSEKKPINFLAYELLKIYFKNGYNYLDIGPASEQGIADFGLCDFKDSIGCMRDLKIKMSRKTE